MVNGRYLVLNCHGKSIIETFFTEAVALILDFRCVPGHIFFTKLTIQNFSVLRLEKSYKIIENIRITISKDHNN